jgi:hypothetical protein
MWSPNLTLETYSVISFFVYNPNDFDLAVAWLGTTYKGFYNVKANTIVEFNIYLPAESAVYAQHGIVDSENKTTGWTIDVRKNSDPNNLASTEYAAYDLYVGGLRVY